MKNREWENYRALSLARINAGERHIPLFNEAVGKTPDNFADMATAYIGA